MFLYNLTLADKHVRSLQLTKGTNKTSWKHQAQSILLFGHFSVIFILQNLHLFVLGCLMRGINDEASWTYARSISITQVNIPRPKCLWIRSTMKHTCICVNPAFLCGSLDRACETWGVRPKGKMASHRDTKETLHLNIQNSSLNSWQISYTAPWKVQSEPSSA